MKTFVTRVSLIATLCVYVVLLNAAVVIKNVNVTDAGTLSSNFTASEKTTVTNLNVSGTIDARDFRFMRDTLTALSVLDMSAANITAYTGDNGTAFTYSGYVKVYDVTTYDALVLPDRAFDSKKKLTSVVLPSSLTAIGNYAFSSCTAIKSDLNIPSTVTTIGEYAFFSCSSMGGIMQLPTKLVTIGQYAFSKCSSVTGGLVIPNTVKTVGKFAFEGCSGLNGTLTTSTAMTKIEESTFYGCTKLTGDVVLGKSIMSVGGRAFWMCSGLNSVTLPSSLNVVDVNAFYGCSSLTSINLPSSLTTLGGGAFTECTKLASISIPNSITKIDDYMFSGCAALASVSIPNSVTYIGNQAFYNCTALSSVTIPGSVTSIGNMAFYGCANLATINFPATVSAMDRMVFDNTAWYNSQPDGVIYLGKILYAYKGMMPENTDITVQDGTVGIAGNAFYGANTLRSVQMPNTVLTIGNSAFYGCSAMTSVVIPNSVTTIDNSAFLSCTALASINFPNTLVMLGLGVFGDTHWFNNQPDGVVYIGKMLYGNKGTMSPWTMVIVNDGTLGIAKNAFNECTGLFWITIPNSVVLIDDKAFFGCKTLQSVDIPSSVKTIGISAFQDCAALTSVTIPASVTKIGDRVLTSCVALTSLYAYPVNPVDPGVFAFYGINKNTCTLYVPLGSKSLYQQADQWKDFLNITEVATGIQQTGVNEIVISPNPVRDGFDIKTETPLVSVTIYDLHGRMLLDRKTVNGEFIQVGHFPSGIYLLSIQTSDGIKRNMKFVKD